MRIIKLVSVAFFLGWALGWKSKGHLAIASIAEDIIRSSAPEVEKKALGMLESLREFFPESKDSILDASYSTDVMAQEYSGFLDFYQNVDTPVLRKGEKIEDVNIEPEFAQNLTYAIPTAVKIIRNYLGAATKPLKVNPGFMDSLSLRNLLLLTGKAHQPGNTISFYSSKLFDGKIVNGSAMGSLIPVNFPQDKKITTLKDLLDSAGGELAKDYSLPLSDEDRKEIKAYANELVKEFPIESFGKSAEEVNPSVWIKESEKLAVDVSYMDVELLPEVRGDFVRILRKMSRSQMALAGYRLAAILKDTFIKKIEFEK